jgi:predicted permease
MSQTGQEENRGTRWIEDAWRDLRFGLRALVRSPSFSAVAVLCLALGIGANAAIFSVINTVLLRPLPFAEPERLVRIYEKLGDRGSGTGSVSVPNYRDWVAQNTGFGQLAAYQAGSRNLQEGDSPERITAVESTPNLFQMLGIPPLAGRTFAPGTDEPGKAQVAVLSEEIWKARFAADRGLVGRTIRLDGAPFTVIGIMPASFDFPAGGHRTDAWLLFNPDPQQAANRGSHYLAVVGRLEPGVSMEQGTSQLVTVAARIEKLYPDQQTGRSVVVMPLRESVVGRVRKMLLVLLGAVGLVLLIACANVANLLLARAAVRQREVAIRLALGAGRARLVRQFLAESLVLSLAGAAVGLLFARWSLSALAPLAERALPVSGGFPLDGTVFAFLLAVAVLSGLVFGTVPAVHASKEDVRDGLNQAGGKSTGSVRQQRFRSGLVVLEIAVSLVLLVGAGLLLRGFLALSGTKPGLVAENVLTAHVAVPAARLDGSTRRFFRPLLEDVRRLPGVRSAAVISMLPIQDAWTNAGFGIEGRPAPRPGQEPVAEIRVVSPGFFQTLGVRILRGRDFEESDGEGDRPAAAIINQVLANRQFPGEDPIGHRLLFGTEPITIVGVVGSIRQAGLDLDPLQEVYFPYSGGGLDTALGDAVLVVKTEVPPASLAEGIRGAVASLDAGLPLYQVLTMEEVIDQSLANRRLILWLLATFAGVALVLSAVGLYGVISYLVAQRTREIGVRLALGARRGDILGMVLRQAGGLAAIGIALGLLAALAVTRVLEGLLYGVSARDPLTYAALAAALAAVTLLATWMPARRASLVDPILAIRAE